MTEDEVTVTFKVRLGSVWKTPDGKRWKVTELGTDRVTLVQQVDSPPVSRPTYHELISDAEEVKL